MRLRISINLTVIMLLTAAAVSASGLQSVVQLSIKPQTVASALLEFSSQANLQVVSVGSEVRDRSSLGVQGKLTAAEALTRLLQGTGLSFEAINEQTVRIKLVAKSVETAQSRNSTADVLRLVQADMTTEEKQEKTTATIGDVPAESKGVPEILVKGQRTLNTDIKRTEDAPQPYVVFGKEEIQRSQALTLEEFLKTRLPMNTAQGGPGKSPGIAINHSSINLRGLGENQTLILVDGRRMPGIAEQGDTQQADINGIPLAAVERIEVLPSTAGGIYGGSATGGVINIVLRRDFQGLEAKATYANTFDTDAANIRLDASAGFSLEGGRTQVMVTATRSEANNLVIGDREFSARAIALQLANNPAAIIAASTPPLGATVNIRSVSGSLVLDPAYGSRSLGSNITHLPLGYGGPASDNGAALAANAGQYNLDLPAGLNGRGRGLVSTPGMQSASLNVRREFGTRLEAFMDLSHLQNNGTTLFATLPSSVTNLRADAPNNPFQQAISVRYPVADISSPGSSQSITVRATGGLIARLPHNWTGEVDYGWSRSRFSSVTTGPVVDSVGSCVLGRGVAANVDPDGTGPLAPCAVGDLRPALNVLQEGNTFPIDFTPYLLPLPNVFRGPYDMILKDTTLRLSGPVANLPGGPLSLSTLLEHRGEGIEASFRQQFDATTRAPTYVYYSRRVQGADSYYLEARAPLISARNARPLARELELQTSVRQDRYRTKSDPVLASLVSSPDGPLPVPEYVTTRFNSTDYTLALRYAPFESLTLRTSFGTGFLPPSVTQVAPDRFTVTDSLGTDPKRGDTNTYVGVPYIRITGGNLNLKPELSQSGSVGLILTPRFAPGLRLSIDYTRIDKVDEIVLPDFQYLLDNEDSYPGRIIRGPKRSGDPVAWAGPITSFDSTYINIATTSVRAYDVQADYTLETERFGGFHGYALATWQPHYRNRVLTTEPVVDSVDFSGGPLEWRGNLGVDWDRGPLTLGLNAQFYNSYYVYTATSAPASILTLVRNQGSARIPCQIYHDLLATYRLDRFNSEVSVGIQNLFGKSPPILAATTSVSTGYSTYGDARLRRYTLSFRKSFGN